VTPLVLDLLAAARADRDPSTGRCDLTGVFNDLTLPLPAVVSFAVYFTLTGFHGPADLAVEFLDPADAFLCGGPVRLGDRDPLAVSTATATFGNVTLARGGTYRLRIGGEDRVLAERPVIVRPAGAPA
jgi:hypothetical protein